MKIVNVKKFIRTIGILSALILICIIFCNKTYSKVEVKYKESYIYSGDTLWTIAQNESMCNKYFENRDVREIIYKLKKVNNLENTNLKEGQKIRIPIYE